MIVKRAEELPRFCVPEANGAVSWTSENVGSGERNCVHGGPVLIENVERLKWRESVNSDGSIYHTMMSSFAGWVKRSRTYPSNKTQDTPRWTSRTTHYPHDLRWHPEVDPSSDRRALPVYHYLLWPDTHHRRTDWEPSSNESLLSLSPPSSSSGSTPWLSGPSTQWTEFVVQSQGRYTIEGNRSLLYVRPC